VIKHIITAIAAGLALAGCVSAPNGSGATPVAAADYNQAIVQTKDEQLLLNLVRLRYRDTTQFLQVTSVADSQTFEAAAGAGTNLSFVDRFLGDIGVSGSAGYSRNPVVSMAPMNDADFAKALLTPISTADLALLAGSGWSIERLLLCCVERFGALSNSPRASGPTPDAVPDNSAYRAFAAELRALQRDERVSLVFENDRAEFLFFGQAEAEAARFAGRYDLPAEDGRLPIVPLTQPAADAALVQTRSILGALYALSHAVDVPAADRAAGLVTIARPSAGTPDWDSYLNGIFAVRSGPNRPERAYVAVPYRGHWFWIDDADLNAKTTFNLMNYLISLKSVSGGGALLLTLGVG